VKSEKWKIGLQVLREKGGVGFEGNFEIITTGCTKAWNHLAVPLEVIALPINEKVVGKLTDL